MEINETELPWFVIRLLQQGYLLKDIERAAADIMDKGFEDDTNMNNSTDQP